MKNKKMFFYILLIVGMFIIAQVMRTLIHTSTDVGQRVCTHSELSWLSFGMGLLGISLWGLIKGDNNIFAKFIAWINLFAGVLLIISSFLISF